MRFRYPLRGNDYDALTEAGDRLVQEIETLPDAIDVKSSASDQVPQVDITLRHTNAARYGLNASTIGSAVRSELDGSTATKLKVDGEEINVSVKGDSRSSTSLDALRAVPIPTNSGGSVPLSVVADVQVRTGAPADQPRQPKPYHYGHSRHQIGRCGGL